MSIAREIGAKAIIYECYLHLSSLNSILGHSDAALEYFKLYTHYKDSVFNVKSNRTLAELQTRYESDRKDKEIAFLENESKIKMLEVKVKAESFIRLTAEKERVQALNLYQSQKIHFLANEKQLHECEIEQNESNLAIQKAESERKQGELDLMAKEDEIQKLIIRKQQQAKNNLLASLGFVSLCSLIGYAYYMTRQQLKLQKLRNKIAADLHDDVGSTLSSIYLFSEMARQQSKEVMPMLDTISESSKKMLDAMADIVWTIHPENDELEKIILRMRSFAYELLMTKQMDFEFDADETLNNLKLSMEVRKNLYLIFKEATNNMVKYSQADYAHFSLSESNRQLTMEIKDNGKGFEMNSLSTGNGLKNMKKRADEIGGKLRIESGINKGTRIQLSVSV